MFEEVAGFIGKQSDKEEEDRQLIFQTLPDNNEKRQLCAS